MAEIKELKSDSTTQLREFIRDLELDEWALIGVTSEGYYALAASSDSERDHKWLFDVGSDISLRAAFDEGE